MGSFYRNFQSSGYLHGEHTKIVQNRPICRENVPKNRQLFLPKDPETWISAHGKRQTRVQNKSEYPPGKPAVIFFPIDINGETSRILTNSVRMFICHLVQTHLGQWHLVHYHIIMISFHSVSTLSNPTQLFLVQSHFSLVYLSEDPLPVMPFPFSPVIIRSNQPLFIIGTNNLKIKLSVGPIIQHLVQLIARLYKLIWLTLLVQMYINACFQFSVALIAIWFSVLH